MTFYSLFGFEEQLQVKKLIRSYCMNSHFLVFGTFVPRAAISGAAQMFGYFKGHP